MPPVARRTEREVWVGIGREVSQTSDALCAINDVDGCRSVETAMARAGQFWTVDNTLVHAPPNLRLSTEGMLCLPEKSPAVTDSFSIVADAVDVSQ